MNVKKIILIFSLLVLFSCEKSADLDNKKIYKKSGVVFTYPGNWEVSEDISTNDVRFIFIESPGAGIMKIEIYKYENSFKLREFVDLDIESVISEMPSALNVKKPDKIEKVEKKIDNEVYHGLMYHMDISILGIEVPHVTEVFEFSSNTQTAYLSGQVAIEDSHLVSTGFDLIISSFKYSKPRTNNSNGPPKNGAL